MNQGKIMTIHCATCGAPARFDVVTQNYHCPSCGGNLHFLPVQGSAFRCPDGRRIPGDADSF